MKPTLVLNSRGFAVQLEAIIQIKAVSRFPALSRRAATYKNRTIGNNIDSIEQAIRRLVAECNVIVGDKP